MSLLRFSDVSLDFGDQVILREANLSLEPGERVCLVGRNGAGKTTLLRLISGTLLPDHGEIEVRSDLRVSQLEQTLPEQLELTAREFVSAALESVRTLVRDFEERSAKNPQGRELRELEELQLRIDALDGWRLEQRVDTTLSELELPADARLDELSGGWRARFRGDVPDCEAPCSDPDLDLTQSGRAHGLMLRGLFWVGVEL